MVSAYRFSLKYASAGANVYLRELAGHDELSVNETGTVGAIALLDRLLVDKRGTTSGVGAAEEITTADRDRILAEIYNRAYGNGIESTISCTACASPFDISFTLYDLLTFVRPEVVAEIPVKQVEEGVFELESGCRFRLPTGSDECAILSLSPGQAVHTLMERCLMQPSRSGGSDQLESVMGRIAPVLTTEMVAQCPECGHRQSFNFDMQSFLLSALMQEKEQITIEIHRLAMTYYWSHEEILSLPRRLRRSYLSFILSEMGV